MKILRTVRGTAVQLLDDGSISFVGGMTIDADGSPHAYGPGGKGLDYLANAVAAPAQLVGDRGESAHRVAIRPGR